MKFQKITFSYCYKFASRKMSIMSCLVQSALKYASNLLVIKSPDQLRKVHLNSLVSVRWMSEELPFH